MGNAATVQDLSGSVLPVFADLGLPYIALARFFASDRSPDVAVLAGDFQRDWAARYLSRDYIGHSRIAEELLLNTSPYSWDEVLSRNDVSPAQRRIREEARDHGLEQGLFTPVRWSDGSYAAVVLAGPDARLEDPFLRTMVEVLSAYYASEARRLMKPTKVRPLTARQRECLQWVRVGKSSTSIAEILGISAETVNEHISQACRKLRVGTRVQAVVEASAAGFLNP
jgi:DNA-binding CsgD family transcriptional regulator